MYLDYIDEKHSFWVYSLNPPKAFVDVSNWINKIKSNFSFIFIHTTIKFKDDEIIKEIIRKNSR
jgi:hypothetical protein